jgi:hypothetical protein
MDEFKFVMKCFLFATAIVVFSQVKANDETFENKAQIFLQDSSTAHFIQQSAEGGAKVLNQSFQTAKSFLKQKMAQAGGSTEPSESKY